MKRIKRIIAALLSCAMIAGFAGCGGSDEPKPDEMRDINAMGVISEIGLGWSLGNTLDATGNGSGVSSETSWGNPVTTQEMIDKVKEGGFNFIRIPTSWGKHMDENNVVNEEWMARVQEVVDYAYNSGMYVILNAHHEDWYDPYYDNADAAEAKLRTLWKQIADRFENYSERLIFEGLNEPRKRNTALEWNGGDQEGWDVVNQLNKAFVETVRNAGGNNPKRMLMICGYAASSDPKVWDAIELPENDENIIVSIHAYLPYNFALADTKTGQPRFDPERPASTQAIDELVDNIFDKFISKGVAVIIGETGARNRDNTEARAAWAEYYTSKCYGKGIPCAWWDNGAFSGSGENFGLLNRRSAEWQYPEVVEALVKGMNEGIANNGIAVPNDGAAA